MQNEENYAARRLKDVETAANDLWHAVTEARRLLALGRPGEASDRLARTRDRCCIDGLIDDALNEMREMMR